jgi:integrase
MRPWDKQKEIKAQDLQVPDIHYIIDTAKGIPNNRTRALYCLLYLTGARICELVRKKGYDLIPEEDNKVTKIFKYHKIANETKDLPSIKKKQLTFQAMGKDKREVMEIIIRNEKHREKKSKSIPIPLDNPEYSCLIEMIKEYTNPLDMEAELFPFNYQFAYRVLKPYFNPHWFRHIRSTHLSLNNNLPGPVLRKYMGWTDDRPAAKYLEINTMDILERL